MKKYFVFLFIIMLTPIIEAMPPKRDHSQTESKDKGGSGKILCVDLEGTSQTPADSAVSALPHPASVHKPGQSLDFLGLPDDVLSVLLARIDPEVNRDVFDLGIQEKFYHLSAKEGNLLSRASKRLRDLIQTNFTLHINCSFRKNEKQEASDYLNNLPGFVKNDAQRYAIYYNGPYVPEVLTTQALRSYHLLTHAPTAERDLLFKLPQVRSISLSKGILRDNNILRIMDLILCNRNCARLSLDVRSIEDDSWLIKFTKLLCENPQLNDLTFIGQNIDSVGIPALFAGISRSGHLRKLILDNHEGEGDTNHEGIESIIKTLSQVTSLEEISLRRQYLNYDAFPDQFEAFISALLQLPSLRFLDLTDNFIEKKELRILRDLLQPNVSLRHLDLSENPISNEGAEYLEEVLSHNNTLKSITIGGATPALIGEWSESHLNLLTTEDYERLDHLPRVQTLPDRADDVEDDDGDTSQESETEDSDDDMSTDETGTEASAASDSID
jgi:hypothetical protein